MENLLFFILTNMCKNNPSFCLQLPFRLYLLKILLKLFKAVEHSMVINELEYIWKFSCFPYSILFHLLDLFIFVIIQKVVCKEWSWISINGNANELSKGLITQLKIAILYFKVFFRKVLVNNMEPFPLLLH